MLYLGNVGKGCGDTNLYFLPLFALYVIVRRKMQHILICCVSSRMSKLAGCREIVCPGLILDYSPTPMLASEVKTRAEQMPQD